MPSNIDNILLCLGRLEGKQDAILTRLGTIDTRLTAHSGRIDKLEKSSTWRAGFAAAIGLIAGWFGKNTLFGE